MNSKHKITAFINNIFQKTRAWLNRNTIASYIIISFAVVFFSEILNRRSIPEAAGFMFISFPAAVLNVIIVFATLTLSLLTKKKTYWRYFITAFWVIISVVNVIMFSFRLMPFSFMDILLIPSTFTVLPVYLSLWQMILAGIVVVALVFALVYIYKKMPAYKVNCKKNIVTCVCAFVMAFVYSLLCRYTGVVDDRITGLIDKYENNGFVYCFSSSLLDMGMSRPEDYSDTRVADVVKEIENYNGDEVINANIIFVQLESFFDVNNVSGVTYSTNPIPFFTELKSEYSHGYLSVPTYSAGTANTEFEILTGMNTDYFGIGEFPYQTVADNQAVESVAFSLKESGYTAHALHNNSAKFYNRDKVYSNLGFDTFTSLEYMYDVRYNPTGWAKDMMLTTGITDAVKSTKGRDFVYAVAVQTHGGYPDDIDEASFEIKVDGIVPESLKSQYSYYVNQLSETDAFIGTLISELQTIPEPTVLVAFGDHLPGIEMNSGFDNVGMYQTEYVMWSNFKTDCVIKNIESYQLYSYVLDRLNIEGGLISKLHRKYAFSADEDYSKDFELLQYHMLYNTSSSSNPTPVYVPSDLKLGVLDIKITDVNRIADVLYVHGDNFNEFSKVFINDKKFETRYIDRHTLTVDSAELSGNDKITVVQVDSNSIELTHSESYICK